MQELNRWRLESYNAFFPAAFAFAQRALAIAASFAFTAVLTFLRFLATFGVTVVPLVLAQRLFIAASFLYERTAKSQPKGLDADD